jgi:hypothetical protein
MQRTWPMVVRERPSVREERSACNVKHSDGLRSCTQVQRGRNPTREILRPRDLAADIELFEIDESSCVARTAK